MILSPALTSTRQFMWQSEHKMFVAEISDLGRNFKFGQVYDDACDEGLTLVSTRTGKRITCGVEHVERDNEGDLLYWDLRPVPGPHRNLFTVRIYND